MDRGVTVTIPRYKLVSLEVDREDPASYAEKVILTVQRGDEDPQQIFFEGKTEFSTSFHADGWMNLTFSCRTGPPAQTARPRNVPHFDDPEPFS